MLFKVSDIFIPDPLVVLSQLYINDLVQGKVLDLSDSGTREDAFAIVQVKHLEQLVVVVPVDRLIESKE